jgi:hypothetical protein
MAMMERQVFNALKLGPGQTLEDYHSQIIGSETVLLSLATSCVRVCILVFSELSCCLGEVAIDDKSLWRYPHVSAIFAEVNATVKS